MTPTRWSSSGDGVVPAGTVEAGTLERIETLDVGHRRVVQHAGRSDDDIGAVVVAAIGLDQPSSVREEETAHLDAEADAIEHAMLPGD